MKSGVAKHLGVAGIQQQNGLVNKTNVTLFAKVRCFLIQSGMSKVFWADDTTMSTYLVTRSPLSATVFKMPIDMLGFFGWLASIKQGMLEPVNVKCIFLGYCKRNICFNESGEYKKTFIDSGVGTGSMQVLHGFEFKVEPLGDHIFELARDREQHLACELFGYKEDINEAAFIVAAVEKIYAHESLTFNDTVACEVIFKWKAGLKDDMDARSDVYALSNGCRKCSDDSDGYYWEYTPGIFIHLFLYINDMVFSCGCKAQIWATKCLLDKAKGNVLGMEIIRDQSGDCDVEKNSKWSCIYVVGSQEYQVVCTRPDIASASVDMSDGFDHGSLKANLQHMKALSITKAGYMTFTEAWKKKIWLKGLLAESGYELSLVAVIATSALVKGGSWSEVPTQVESAAYRYTAMELLNSCEVHNDTPHQVFGCAECIEQFLNNFANQPDETDMNNLEFDDESVDTPLVSPFPHSNNDSNDGEVLNELMEYENVGMVRRERAINSFNGDDLAFQCMIGFRKFVAYFDPFLPMNIITRKAYNTIMVEGLESTKENLVFIRYGMCTFCVVCFTCITDFVVLEDIRSMYHERHGISLDGQKSLSSNMTLLRDWSHSLRSLTHTYLGGFTYQAQVLPIGIGPPLWETQPT
ncbi:hypothetical protein Tco_0809834 [Tanacetum coccineum]